MAAITKSLGILFFFTLISEGMSQRLHCTKEDILVQQTSAVAFEQSTKAFQVTLFNACPCIQKNAMLDCKGFQTAVKIDPSVLVITGDECQLPKGSFIPPFTGYGFAYDWNTNFPFKVISSEVDCS